MLSLHLRLCEHARASALHSILTVRGARFAKWIPPAGWQDLVGPADWDQRMHVGVTGAAAPHFARGEENV